MFRANVSRDEMVRLYEFYKRVISTNLYSKSQLMHMSRLALAANRDDSIIGTIFGDFQGDLVKEAAVGLTVTSCGDSDGWRKR